MATTMLCQGTAELLLQRGQCGRSLQGWRPEGADSGDEYFTGTAIVTGNDVSVSMDGITSRTFSSYENHGLCTVLLTTALAASTTCTDRSQRSESTTGGGSCSSG